MFTLTEAEMEILLDRPEDCIVESVSRPHVPFDNVWHPEKIEKVIEVLHERIVKNELDVFTKTEIAVLCDMVRGSTWYARHESACGYGEITHQKLSAVTRQLTKLQRKISGIVGQTVMFPLY